MIFNSILRTMLYFLMLAVLAAGCSSNPEKSASDNDSSVSAENKSADKKSEVDSPTKPVVLSPALPAGPITPNPYRQSKAKISSQVDISFRDAVAAMQQKNWPQAESLLQALTVANPTLSGVQLNLGIVYRAKNDLPKAAEAFNRAITVNPKNIDAYNQLALLKRESGEFAAAETLYQKALSVWPFHPESHKNIAILYELYMGKPEQALPHFQAYQQLLSAPDKQVDSWVADLQRRVGGGASGGASAEKETTKADQVPEVK